MIAQSGSQFTVTAEDMPGASFAGMPAVGGGIAIRGTFVDPAGCSNQVLLVLPSDVTAVVSSTPALVDLTKNCSTGSCHVTYVGLFNRL